MSTDSGASVISDSLRDPERFELVLDRHFPPVYRYMRRRVGEDVARELVAERRFDHGRPTTEQTFAAIGQLLLDSSSPSLRAALYRLIAAQPGVQLLGPETEEAIVQAAKARRGPLTPIGTPLGYTVFIRRGVVNRIDELPGGGRLPLRPSVS